MKNVVILQHRLLHYRVNLFDRLRSECSRFGINLILVHGQASTHESKKRDEGFLSWSSKVKNLFFRFGSIDLIWQPVAGILRDSDLVIVMQENRILSNYLILLSRFRNFRKVAYWGHGANFQSQSPSGFRERWKRFLLNRVDWWFAYTQATVDILMAANYPASRITCLDNAIDNSAFENDLISFNESDLKSLRAQINASEISRIGLYCGSLYPDKRLGYLLDSVDLIHANIPSFHMVVIGDGPSADEIRMAMDRRPWLHWLGVLKGREKAAWFKLANVIINPGAVGLHVLDSFCAGVPMVTCADSKHGPEFAYLSNGRNGLVVNGGPEQYANAVVELLSNDDAYRSIQVAALDDARKYTLDNMVNRFVEGINRCLEEPCKS